MKKLTAFIALALAISLTACKQENDTMPDAVQSNIGVNSSYNMIMETENGYYCNSNNFGQLSLRYLDKETGKDIYLCAKPECLHDGSRFCPATNSSFDVLYTAMYGDAVYIAVQCREEDDRYSMKLLRATQNGTELSEVCTYIKGSGELTPQIIANESKQMVIHRGYAFVPYRLYSGADNVSKNGAYIIDINSGKYDKVCEYSSEETNGVCNITAQGDSFYYTLKMNSGGTDELYRYDIGTKKPKPLGLYDSYKRSFGNNFAITDYTVIDGKVWYTKYSASTYDPYSNVFIFDPETGETTDNTEFTLYEETFDVDGERFSRTAGILNGGITFDGEYLYLANNGFSSHGDTTVSAGKPNCTIFSLDGERLGKCIYEDIEAESYAVNIAFGKIYLQTEKNVLCCNVSDVISGEYEWTEVLTFENTESISSEAPAGQNLIETVLFPNSEKSYSNTNTVNNKNSVVSAFCYNDNTVYFSINGALYSYDENTRKTEKLINAFAFNISFCDGCLYFLESKTDRLENMYSQYVSGIPCELNLSDLSLTRLSDFEVNDLIVNEDGIFYTKYSYAGDELPSGVYRLDRASGEGQRLYNGWQYNCYENKWIGFENSEDGYKCFLFNDTDKIVLTQEDVPQRDCIFGDNYYYVSLSDGTLNRVSLKTGERTANIRLSDEELEAGPERGDNLLTVIDYTIFNEEIYFIGSDMKQLCKYDEAGGIIYYTGNDNLRYLYSTDNGLYAVKVVFRDNSDSMIPSIVRLSTQDTQDAQVISEDIL